MINSINSYSNYNYANTFSNTPNTKSSNVINKTSNLVSDKSQVVNKVLGYGVDKDGFFTSDFNEKAGIPKDYKIYAKDMQSFVEWETGDRYFYATHTSIDIAKTIGNAYKVLSQIMPTTSNASLSEEELTNIPYAFVLDKNLNVTKTFTKDEYEKIDLTQDRINLTFNTFSNVGFDKISIDNIFSHSNGDVRLNKNAYINKDGSVDKGGILMALLNSQLYGATSLLLEGDTRLFGKITTDKNISNDEREAFQNFMNTNKIQSAFLSSSNPNEWNPFEERLSMKLFIRRSDNIGNTELSRLAMDLDKEYQEMINSNMSLEEFKTKYLDFKQRHDEFVKSLEETEKAKGVDYSNPLKNTNNKETSEEDKEKPFKPIQAESKNKETYKDDNVRNELVKKLLEGKFSTSDELEILFGMKFSDDDTGEFNKILSLNSTPKGIDIKA
ncbi:Cj0814 family flagellar-dependent secreted protein [Campylobacter coli]